MKMKSYFTAQIYGMCGGVHAALKTLEELLDSSGQGVFVFHELVHNRAVTDSFKRKGAQTINPCTFLLYSRYSAASTSFFVRRSSCLPHTFSLDFIADAILPLLMLE